MGTGWKAREDRVVGREKGGKGEWEGRREKGGVGREKGGKGGGKGEGRKGWGGEAYLDECYPAVREVFLHCLFVHLFPHWSITLHHLQSV